MNDTATVEQDQQTEADAPVSIMEHAAQFGPNAQPDTPEPVEFVPPNETAEQKVAREHHSAQQRRDRENGQFQNGRKRHRAASAQATPDDLAAINDLTRRIKSAEEADGAHIKQNPGESQRVFELRRRAELAESRKELATLRAQRAPAAQIAQAETKVERAEAKVEQPRAGTSTFTEPEPKEDDPKFNGDYGQYFRALAGWEGRKAYHESRAADEQRAAQQASEKTMAERLVTAKGKYPDFEAAAERVLARIPPQSITEGWIFKHKLGDDVLHYFDSHPQELDAILQMPEALDQVEALTLLSQRFASSPKTSGAAGTTASAPERKTIVLPPKPFNAVGTEAQRASDSPPSGEPSSIAEHRKHFAPKSR